jgi:hypothetical protein
MGFDTNKWFKQKYLSEAGIILESELVKALNQAIPDNTGYKEFAKAVATILKDEYGSHNFGPFMEVLHAELGINESINEAETSDIEKIDFAFVEGTTKFYGAYIYNKGSKNWDKKLRSNKEVQDFLTSLGIDIEFEYNNLPEIFKALEAKGIKAEDSEFDIS